MVMTVVLNDGVGVGRDLEVLHLLSGHKAENGLALSYCLQKVEPAKPVANWSLCEMCMEVYTTLHPERIKDIALEDGEDED